MAKNRSEPINNVATRPVVPAVAPFRENQALPMIYEVRARFQELEAKVQDIGQDVDMIEAAMDALTTRINTMKANRE
jgi:hypothetical protein